MIGNVVPVSKAELPLLVKEAGADRRVILHVLNTAADFKALLAAKEELQKAGFTNVVIGAAVGE